MVRAADSIMCAMLRPSSMIAGVIAVLTGAVILACAGRPRPAATAAPLVAPASPPPTAVPTAEPAAVPTAEPTAEPAALASAKPVAVASARPAKQAKPTRSTRSTKHTAASESLDKATCAAVATAISRALATAPTPEAERGRLAALTATCTQMAWSADLRECFVSSPDCLLCTQDFGHDQDALYSMTLNEWRERYGVVP
jgi:hypothetical protein